MRAYDVYQKSPVFINTTMKRKLAPISTNETYILTFTRAAYLDTKAGRNEVSHGCRSKVVILAG